MRTGAESFFLCHFPLLGDLGGWLKWRSHETSPCPVHVGSICFLLFFSFYFEPGEGVISGEGLRLEPKSLFGVWIRFIRFDNPIFSLVFL